MPVDRILQKLRAGVKDLAAALENFSDTNVQPGVDECAKLQSQLHLLLEDLAVYKHQKTSKEISPSFNLHAKVSEAPAPPTVSRDDNVRSILPDLPPPAPKAAPANARASKTLNVGINDKFRFINELFAQNAQEYSIALEQLSSLGTWNEAELYLNSLKQLYSWKSDSETAKQLYAVVKKRFA